MKEVIYIWRKNKPMFVRGGGSTLIVRQASLIFYETYDDDAIILNYLFNYKITGSNRVGFPNTALNKY